MNSLLFKNKIYYLDIVVTKIYLLFDQNSGLSIFISSEHSSGKRSLNVSVYARPCIEVVMRSNAA